MSQPLRLGIAGLGTVGIGTVKIVQNHLDLLARRSGRPITISAISARDRKKNRDADLSAYSWEDDPVQLAGREDIDVFVELMGGHEGKALAATRAAIAAGKDVVTANKAMLAHHGQALAEEAEAKGSVIRFEAAVAGGIPVVKALTEGLAGNRITRVLGVMNGTCNYILTRMEATGQGYNVLFDECARLGYLEADPNLDWRYRIRAGNEGPCVGALSRNLTYDLWEILANKNQKNSHKPPGYVNHVRGQGCATVVLSPDDTELDTLNEPWASSGFVLTPRIVAFPPFFFFSRR